jgi:hypothetical protein
LKKRVLGWNAEAGVIATADLGGSIPKIVSAKKKGNIFFRKRR